MFPPKLWNLFESAKEGLPRTNNNVEGWHNSFASMVSASRVNIYRFIEALKEDYVLTSKKFDNVAQGVGSTSKKKYKDASLRLKSLAEKYKEYRDQDDILQYLRAISYNFKL